MISARGLQKRTNVTMKEKDQKKAVQNEEKVRAKQIVKPKEDKIFGQIRRWYVGQSGKRLAGTTYCLGSWNLLSRSPDRRKMGARPLFQLS